MQISAGLLPKIPIKQLKILAVVASMLAIPLVSTRPVAAVDYNGVLPTNAWLRGGESLWSPNRLFRLTQQGDGNLVMYAMPGNKPLWASGTVGARYAATQMQGDGNLVIRAEGNRVAWASNSKGRYPVLNMQNDANLVVRAEGNVPVWSTGAGSQGPGSCIEGSRDQASQFAASGQFYVAGPRVRFSDPIGRASSTAGWVEMRYHPASRCAWALGGGGAIVSIWLDRSHDGGRTFYKLGRGQGIGLGGINHDGVYKDGAGSVTRACTTGNSINFHCTIWY